MVAFTATLVPNDATACITCQGKGSPDQGLCNVYEVVQQTTYDLLGVSQLQGDAPLMDAGVDSLSAVEYRTRLSKALGVTLPSTLVFDYPSITAISHYISTNCCTAPQCRDTHADGPSDGQLAGLDSS
jgi:acyl carrier protein